jgi:hypothetical protein
VTNRSAIITIVRDEAIFFPIWLRYYSRHFAPDDIYVLDHETTDGSTSGGGFVRIPVTNDSWSIAWMVDTVRGLQHELIGRYDVVVVTDVDEIIAPDPHDRPLRDYLATFDDEFVNCFGHEILHVPEEEPPFDPSRPVLEQRHWWFVSGIYNKPSVATVPMDWKLGFHVHSSGRLNLDWRLRLIHLHRLDYRMCLERHRRNLERKWADLDLTEGLGTHNRIVDEAEFDEWFRHGTHFGEVKPARIPPRWVGQF